MAEITSWVGQGAVTGLVRARVGRLKAQGISGEQSERD